MTTEKRHKLGVILIIFPPILLVSVLMICSIVSFLAINLGQTVARLASISLSALGLLAMVGIVFGIPAGIILLLISDKEHGEK